MHEEIMERSSFKLHRKRGILMGSLVTGKVRFSYVSVFEPRSVNGGEEKYSATLLIPKADTKTYQDIMTEINKCLQESLAEVFKGVMPANPSIPIYDGDGVRQSGEAFGPECKGCWVISAKSNSAPEVVDANVQPIISKNEFYSGCYGRASLRFYAYNKNGNKGIGCGLGNVQKLEDGQPLDGRTTAAEDFGAFTQTTAPQQYQLPTQPVAPQPIPQQAMQPATPAYTTDQFGQPVVPPTNPVNPTMGQPIVNNIYGVN